MIKIAHRGNISNNPENDNVPGEILKSISAGYDVEIDLWKVGGMIYLGHDGPQYLIDESFLIQIGSYAWIHCKNIEALYFLNTTFPQLNYFWHEEDQHTLTSQGYIWTYPGFQITNKSIIVDLENFGNNTNAYGVCSDRWEY